MRKAKKLLALFLCLVMLVGLFPTAALAEESAGTIAAVEEAAAGEGSIRTAGEAEGTQPPQPVATMDGILDAGSCGDGLTWRLTTDGRLTISGTGTMTDYSNDTSEYPIDDGGNEHKPLNPPWLDYEVLSVTVEEGVSYIGSYAFWEQYSLASVSLPESLRELGVGCFQDCSALTEIELPEELTVIGDSALSYTGLCSVLIPPYVTSLGNFAFSSCDSLTEVRFRGNAPAIGERAFFDTTATVYYPADDATWTEEIRQNYDGTLTWTAYDSGTLANGICGDPDENRGLNVHWLLRKDGLFIISGSGKMYAGAEGASPWIEYKDQIRALLVREGVTSLSSYGFANCSQLTDVRLPESMTSIGKGAFLNSGLTGIHIPAQVVQIGDDALSACSALKSITVAEDSLAFSALNGLLYSKNLEMLITCPGGVTGELTLPDQLRLIKSQAFAGCSGLTGVSIGENVTSIPADAFSGCSKLESIRVAENSASFRSQDGILYEKTNHALIVCPQGKGGSIVVPEGVTGIGRGAFSGCSSITEVSLPIGLQQVQAAAFSNCKGLTTIHFLGSAPTIEGDAFEGVFATVYYPANDSSWTKELRRDYGGTLFWNAYDPTVIASDISGDGLKWSLHEDGTLVISGTGDMMDYEYADAAWTAYKSQIRTLVVESGVSSIGERSFRKLDQLTQITLPEGITRIGSSAFHGCTALQSITLPASLETVGGSAFSECGALEAIAFPAGLKTLGSWAFSECPSLGEIRFPGSAPSIGDNAFSGVTATVYFPSEDLSWTGEVRQNYGGTLTWVTENGESPILAGGTCEDHLTWTLNEAGVLTISGTGAMMDYSCWMGEPWTVNTPWYEYRDVYTTVVVESGVTKVGRWAFGLSGALTHVSLPEGLQTIANCAFYSCNVLEEVRLPEGLTTIGAQAFFDCPELRELVLPESLTKIQNTAFKYCSSLQTLTVPASVTDIQAAAFSECKSLSRIHFEGPAPAIAENAFTGVSALVWYPPEESWTEEARQNYGGSLTWLPEGTEPTLVASGECGAALTWTLVEGGFLTVSGTGPMSDWSWNAEAPWAQYRDTIVGAVIEPGVTSVGAHAFRECTALRSVTIPETVTVVGDWAFDYCESLGQIAIPGSVTNIEDFAFLYCSGLKTLKLAEGLKSIGIQAFQNCSSLRSVTIPGSVTAVYEQAFGQCSSLTEILVEEGAGSPFASVDGILFSRDQHMLLACPAGKSGVVTVPEGVTAIGPSAFDSCSRLTQILLPEGLTTVEPFAFNCCSGLGSLTLPASLTDLRSGFYGCESLTRIEVAEGSASYASLDGVLYDRELTSLLVCPAGMSEAVVIPVSVTRIESGAFSCCESLREIHFLGDLPSLEENEFEDVTATVYYPAENNTWTEEARQNYGGSLTWLPEGTEPAHETSGTCGEHLTWALDEDGLLTISGTGAMTDWSWGEDTPWITFRDRVTAVLVEPGVTSIGSTAFKGFEQLGSLSLPETLESVGMHAFSYCSSLTEVTIPNGVRSLEYSAFFCCTDLRRVTLPASLTEIEEQVFARCSSLTEILVAEGENAAFSSLDGILYRGNGTTLVVCPAGKSGELRVPDGVTTIADSAFESCSGLTGILLPEGLDTIESFAFHDCSGLTCLTFPASVTDLSYGFYGCTNLTSFEVEEGSESYASLDGVLYNKEMTQLIACPARKSGVFSVPGTVTSIGEGAFSDCTELTRVDLPESVTAIGESAFSGCSSLAELHLPAGMTRIEGWTFSDCPALESITIPAGVTLLGYGAFYGCTGLREIRFLGDAPAFEEDVFSRVTATAYYPAGNETWTEEIRQDYGGSLTWEAQEPASAILASGECGEALTWTLDEDGLLTVSGTGPMNDWGWGVDTPWTAYQDRVTSVLVEPGVTSIGVTAFQSLRQLRSLSLPETLERVGMHAFAYCSGLTEVTVPNGVTSLAYGAFFSCTNLRRVTLPASLTEIGGQAFASCGSLTEFLVSEGENAFYSALDGILYSEGGTTLAICPAARSGVLEVPDGVTAIGKSAFESCSGLTEIRLPESLTTIRGDAFRGCSGLTVLTIPAGVTDLTYGFYHCDNLTRFEVAEGSESYASLDGILYDKGMTCLVACPVRKSGVITVPGTVTRIGASAFSACSELTGIELPKGVTAIGDEAFFNCSGLTQLQIPAGVTEIEKWTFANCSALESVTIPVGVTSLGIGAFSGCTSLREVRFRSDGPSFAESLGANPFENVTATVYYPAGNETWTEELRQDYGGSLTWVASSEDAGTCGQGLTWTLSAGTLTISGSGAMDDYARGMAPWYGYRHSIRSVVVEAGVTSIGAYAFADLIALTEVDDGVDDGESDILIAPMLPRPCASVSSVTVPLGLMHIGEGAFAGCTGLEELTVPQTVESIGEGAFKECPDLETITFEGGAPEGEGCLDGVEAVVVYPYEGSGWTEETRRDYGGTVAWVADGQPIEENAFPDPTLRSLVSQRFDSNGDGALSGEEVAAVKSLDLSGMGVSSLEGIACLAYLESLSCSGNALTALELPTLPQLKMLDCSDNALTALELSGVPQLECLLCYHNQIASLDLTPCRKLVSANRLAPVTFPNLYPGREDEEPMAGVVGYGEAGSQYTYSLVVDETAAVIRPSFLSLDACGGTVEPGELELAGESLGELPVPTREGWVFLGWYLEPAATAFQAGQGTQVTAETCLDGDATVYAHWYLPGDLNGDGNVDNKDVTRLIRYIKYSNVDVVAPALDVNGDEQMNNKDVTRLIRFIKYRDVDIF